MRSAAGLLAVVLSAAAGGCSSSTPTAPAGTATFSGAITGSSVVSLGSTYSVPDGLRFFIQSPADVYPALGFEAALPGTALQALTYDDTNGTAASTTVQEAATGGITWTQVSEQESTVGTFALLLSDAGESEATDGGTGWPSPQGCLTATLVPVGTLTDAGVTVVVVFTAAASCP